MSKLPQGWAHTSLGSISLIDMGQSPNGTDVTSAAIGFPLVGGALEFKGGGLVSTRFTTRPTKLCERDDIILCIRATIGKVAIADKQYCLGRGVAGIRAIEIERDWLKNLLFWSGPEIDRAGTGSTFRQVDKKTLLNWPVDLPPLTEQRRITVKLDRLLSCTARAKVELDVVPTLIANYKKAILSAAFLGDLTKAWRKKIGSTAPKEVALKEVAASFSYGSSTKSSPEGKVPVLRMGNIQDGKLDWSDLVYTSDPAEIAKYELKPGDVLFNRTNSPALVGKTALYRSERKAIYAGYLIRVRCSDRLLPEFLAYCLNGPAARAYCWQVKTDGVSQSNINAKKLAAFTFLLPSIEEQTEIVRLIVTAFSWLDSITKEYSRVSKLVPNLNQAILDKAFRGELVLQDPNDESATILLDRIRTERADHPKPKARQNLQPKRSKTMASFKERIESDLQDWPEHGLTFEQIRQRVAGDYEGLQDAIFVLLRGTTPMLCQEFDQNESIMRIRKIAK